MFLAVDIGNTESVFGFFENGKLTHRWSTETRTYKTADQIAAFFLPLCEHHQIKAPWAGVGLCSVVPTATRAMREFCERYLDTRPFLITPQTANFPLNVKEPESVGADRIANVAFARESLSLPAVVVDFGTATTLDIISKEGAYEGGAILPGIGLSFEALNQSTSKLALVDADFPSSVVGKTTTECIQSGILFGYCEQIEGLIRRTESEMKETLSVTLTGGYSRLFRDRICRSDFNLDVTLKGISLLFQKSL